MNGVNVVKIKSRTGKLYIFDAIDNNFYEVEDEFFFNRASILDLGHNQDIRVDALGSRAPDDDAQKNAKTLILELTEECNMRCKYCIYDETSGRDRPHSSGTISLETALSEIDKFYERTNKERAYIVFYGGEPLIEFSMINDIVLHTSKKYGNIFKYSITTNGILLTKEKFYFFVRHDFLITISIDGPIDVNDKMRVLRNGKGTHTKVEKNILALKQEFGDYFESNVIYNCTINNENDIPRINEYFRNHESISSSAVRFAPSLNVESRISNQIINKVSMEKLRNTIKNRGQVLFGPVENNLIGSILDKIRFRKVDEKARLGKKICVPFGNRTYIRSSGSLQFCERIGNYGTISNAEEIKDSSLSLSRTFVTLKEKDCAQCFAYNFCEMCPASFIEFSEYSENLSTNKCDSYRTAVIKSLEIYVEEMESQDAHTTQ